MLNRIEIVFTVIVIGLGAAAGGLAAGEPTAPGEPPYKNDPAIVQQLQSLGDNAAMVLPIKVAGLEGGWERNDWLGTGPFTRAYCVKMAYVPDRKTAFYCGQDHNLPHFNDCWEFHLGSATWHCLSTPDGGDCAGPSAWPGDIKKEQDPRKRKAIEDKQCAWMETYVKFENGYLQTKNNDGPVFGWHTWDGLAYDPRVGRVFWAELDDDETQLSYLKTYCQVLGKDFEAKKKNLKPGTGMWSFDPGTKRWCAGPATRPMPGCAAWAGRSTTFPTSRR